MNIVDTVSVVLGSTILLGLLTLVAINGARRRHEGRQVVSAVDSKWQKLKVEMPV
ncbi:hypothetical protein [Candidatus Nitrososphaera gargensis]|uniref:hypothetical protein n=1 Tax=Candidatus Nitrososphaera gargensis TaxID=497727 RepID=UPI00164F784C|nr:hypothetical protein [Candidatus Nitrososphaera gargensis]